MSHFFGCGFGRNYLSGYGSTEFFDSVNGTCDAIWLFDILMRKMLLYKRTTENAEAFVAGFVEWYNYEHLHSALDLLTPFSVIHGLRQEIPERRKNLLEEARANILSDTEQGRRGTGLNRRPA